MLNTWQISQLIEPVIYRAQADFDATSTGFVDRAARYVLKRLGCDTPISRDGERRQRQQLDRCRWIDDAVLAFFVEHPLGEGIEVGGGLSTRFHRISERLDWPKFFWRAINTLDVSDCLQFVFPPMDNFTSVTSDSPLNHWVRYVYWLCPKAKIVILAEDRPLKEWHEFIDLAASIHAEMTNATATIDVLLTHSIDDLPDKVLDMTESITVHNAMPQPTPKNSLISWFSRSAFELRSAQTIHTHHLIFSRHSAKELEGAQ